MKVKTGSPWAKIVLAALVGGVIEILWTLYNIYVPLWLQSGNPGFKASGTSLVGFGFSASVTGIILTIDNVAGLFISPVAGALSDTTRTRWGRRMPWIAIATPIGALAFMLLPVIAMQIPAGLNGQTTELTRYFVPFMASLLFIILPLSIMRNPAEALLYDITPSSDRTMASAISNLVGAVSGIIASIVAAGLFAIHAGLPFWLFGVMCIVLIALVALFVKEPQASSMRDSDDKTDGFTHIVASLKSMSAESKHSLLFILLSTFFFYLAFSQLGSFISSYAVVVLGMSTGSSGLFYAAGGAAFFVGAMPAGIIAKKLTRKKTAAIGLVVFAVVAALIYVSTNHTVIWVAMMIGGFFSSFTMVSLDPMVVDSAPNDDVLGTLLSIQRVGKLLSYVAGPILGGFLIEYFGNNYRNTWLVILFGCVAGAVALIPIRKGEQREVVQESSHA